MDKQGKSYPEICILFVQKFKLSKKEMYQRKDNNYVGPHYILYMAVLFTLLIAIQCGFTISFEMMINVNKIIDIGSITPPKFYWQLFLYFFMGQITGTSISSKLAVGAYLEYFFCL